MTPRTKRRRLRKPSKAESRLLLKWIDRLKGSNAAAKGVWQDAKDT